MERDRIQKIIDIVGPALARRWASAIKAGLTPADMSTNEFIDTQHRRS